MEVEHLWQYNEGETPNIRTNTNNPDFLANLCNIADHRLYKIVKWCKSLPLFKNISVRLSLIVRCRRSWDDQKIGVRKIIIIYFPVDRRSNIAFDKRLVRITTIQLLLPFCQLSRRDSS